jgi:hypothetical protein
LKQSTTLELPTPKQKVEASNFKLRKPIKTGVKLSR